MFQRYAAQLVGALRSLARNGMSLYLLEGDWLAAEVTEDLVAEEDLENDLGGLDEA